jgi:hypothetical protein
MKTKILAIGRNEEILQTVLRLINKNEAWEASGALTDEAAFRLFDSLQPSLVLLCSGISEASEQALRTYFTGANPALNIIQHYGGGSGLLSNEIIQALEVRVN